MDIIKTQEVRSFWDSNPLCASAIPYPLGTKEYFDCYDKLREANENLEFSYRLHEYKQFSGKRVLDVGCGNGYVLSKYSLEGAEAHGVDITPTGIELCRRRFDLSGLKGSFLEADAEGLPFDNETFDCVCSMGVLHHIPNTEKGIAELRRVLKKGGRLIVMFYHRNSAYYRISMPLLGAIKGKKLEQLVNEVDGEGNPKGEVYSKRQLKELLPDFEDIEMFAGFIEGRMVFPGVGKLFPNFLFKPLEKRFGWFLYAKGIKP